MYIVDLVFAMISWEGDREPLKASGRGGKVPIRVRKPLRLQGGRQIQGPAGLDLGRGLEPEEKRPFPPRPLFRVTTRLSGPTSQWGRRVLSDSGVCVSVWEAVAPPPL